MRRVLLSLIGTVALAVAGMRAAPETLEIYFIDVEGGQSTLMVAPTGESLLIDAGFPGGGTFQSRPGDVVSPRDPVRIAAVAREAGLSRIDTLLITHFHGDHFGGVMELAQRIPIGTFVDHGDVPAEAEWNVPGTLALFQDYQAIRAKGRHLQPKIADRLPVRGLDVLVVSSAGTTVVEPLPGAGGRNQACGETARPAQEVTENPRSTGVLIQFGNFRFLDLGDLTGAPLFDLACPRDRIGPVDVYLVAHHGGADAADPATLAAFRPRVAILDNGATKGAGPEMLAALHGARDIDTWQLHRSVLAGAENFPEDRLANLDETTAHWIKVSAKDDGSFRVTNGRTGHIVSYVAR